ncbi:NitT/TauT family transport system permease protein [Rhizobium sp. PP-CC-3A-592]|nr:NitT/TauT family transport system permease protein [Rhizobium sp. PP-CC-3A-592]
MTSAVPVKFHEAPPTIAPVTGTPVAHKTRRTPFYHQRAIGFCLIAALLCLWEIVARFAPSPGLPAPTRIAGVWHAEMTTGDLPDQLANTMISMAYGYVIAAFIGITIGVLMARVRFIYAIFEPIVELIRPIPTIVFIPVIILYVGLGREMNVLAIVISATEPILIASFAGARAVPQALKDTAASFRLTWWQTLVEIVLPAALPQIMVGLRLALASSLVIAIASGMIAGNAGVGFYILTAQQTLDISRMYAGAATVAVIGYALNFGFLTIERHLLHWHVSHDRKGSL